MFLQGLYAVLLSWRNSHVGSTWSWYMMWSGEIFFRSLERSNFLSVWPSSVSGDLSDRINLLIAIMRSSYFADRDVRNRINSPIAIMQSCYFADCNVRDRINLPIAIYAIVLFRRSQFTWSYYFSRSKVQTPGQTVQFFIGPGFDSQARLPVPGHRDSWPM